ncbi:LytTR family DNA-binding domain-containing protein [Undibacterium sp. TS12]|uniref:LytR/AlgR family response regulator transcription factor n=1 Tax=Undibacterium sp. TS12 TaxID=2908202 RepID=UPI001F4D26A1|nr:LytTR family DNA-binding domain-containing protein [Undibacterium sp. TS12]MCH8618225.1 LytTR family DNA-binding domain-containing protein [Undibacterium sp. TS12]
MDMAKLDKPSCIIVDDEEHARVTLRYALGKHSDWQVLAEFRNAASAREFLAAHAVDVVFLDIQMPKESGLELARTLAAQARPPLVIFVTAFNAHAVDAFELHALDYLLKPFKADRFAQTLERAREMLAYTRQAGYGQVLNQFIDARKPEGQAPVYVRQVVVRSIGEMESILLDQVYWMAAAGNYVELHLDKRVVLHRVPLSKLEEYLDPQQFLRVHRSVIVRTEQCAHLLALGNGSYQLRLRCGDEVQVSKSYVDAVRQALSGGV